MTFLHAETQAPAVNRTILAIYNSQEDYSRAVDRNLIHNHAEMVLNYLGMKVKLYDISQGLPGDETMRDVYGIFCWFLDEKMNQPKDFCVWAAEQIRQGKKIVLIKSSGAFKDVRTNEVAPADVSNILFKELGLYYGEEWSENPFALEIAEKDSAMVEFERTLDNEVDVYEKIDSINPANKIYLKIRRTDVPDRVGVAVVTTPTGGFVLGHYAVFINYRNDCLRWRINPFSFFEEAYALKGEPRYDTTTLFGRRILYVHIDGDGFRNVSEIDSQSFSSEIIRDQILKVYLLPTTASVVASEIDPRYLGSPKLVSVAQDIFRIPHVEVGVHGFSHPLDWTNQLTAFEIEGYSKRDTKSKNGDIASESAYGNAAKALVDQETFLKRETQGAAEYLNEYVVPAGKKVVINQWTGNCQPPARAIDLVNEAGLKNINGGDTRFDRSSPTYTQVSPLTRQIDGRIQNLTSAANENIYTNLWTGPYDNFSEVIETFQQTEYPTLIKSRPRRVTPINVYYHFYSGEKRAALNALKEVYDYVMAQDTIPIFTSEYASVVEGFHSGKIDKTGEGTWRFSGYGHCRTVRFDDAQLWPDLDRSSGILGFKKWNDCLYVHLDEKEEAVLFLTGKMPTKPYLVEASSLISELTVSQERITFLTTGIDRGFYRFANMASRSDYEIEVTAEASNKILHRGRIKSKKDGQLEINAHLEGRARVAIKKIQ